MGQNAPVGSTFPSRRDPDFGAVAVFGRKRFGTGGAGASCGFVRVSKRASLRLIKFVSLLCWSEQKSKR